MIKSTAKPFKRVRKVTHKQQYVYAYFVPEMYNDKPGIKIGRGSNPVVRMQDYAEKHALKVSPKHLYVWPMPSLGAAVDAEKWLHEHIGLDAYTSELFGLGQHSFNEVLQWVDDSLMPDAIRLTGVKIKSAQISDYRPIDPRSWREIIFNIDMLQRAVSYSIAALPFIGIAAYFIV